MGLEEDFKQEFEEIRDSAVKEAIRLNHNYIGTEHLLLALISAGELAPDSPSIDSEPGDIQVQVDQILGRLSSIPYDAVICNLVQDMGIDPFKIKSVIEFIVGRGQGKLSTETIKPTPRSERVNDIAYDNYRRDHEPRLPVKIHVLHGLYQEGEGVAASILESLGMRLDQSKLEAEKYRPKPT